MPRLEWIMNRQPVTLRAHDSINLTTGVVTRSPATAQPHLLPGLRRNDLRHLHAAIIAAPVHTPGPDCQACTPEPLPCGHGKIHQGSSGECLRCFASASHADRLRDRNLRGLRANYLVALALVIDQDPSIPSA
jgi:hypothetical protein